jgi:hypothetical protein
MAVLRVVTPNSLVLANGDDRFNTGMRPASICAAESRPPDLVAIGRTAGSIGAGEEGDGGGEEAVTTVDATGR